MHSPGTSAPPPQVPSSDGPAAHLLFLEEAQARRVVLAQAIETTDLQGRWVTPAERDAIDLQAVEAARAAQAADGTVPVAPALHRRAELVLAAAGARQSGVAALQRTASWPRWLPWALPLAALVLGVATDRVANPHRVDLLSLPLLGLVVWNLLMYAVLAAAALRARMRPAAPQAASAPLAGLRHWLQDARASLPRWRRDTAARSWAEVAAAFTLRWQALTAPLAAQRLKLVLHLSAAAWGAGVALSLLLRGTVVAYRAGWESTFLDAQQVHAVLSLLFMPVVALFSLDSLTVQDIARMQFDVAGSGMADGGRRWALLYVGLLGLMVVLPRLILSGLAAWRARRLSRRVGLDLGDPYFQRLIDQLIPAQLRVAVLAHRDEDRAALLRVLWPQAAHRPPADAVLLRTPTGDALRLAPPAEADVLLQVLGQAADLEAAPAGWRPDQAVLLLVRSPADGADADDSALLALCERQHHGNGPVRAVLGFADFARCWVQETAWLHAMARCVPRASVQGWARLAQAWLARNLTRFDRAMGLLARELADAAAQSEAADSAPLSVKHLLSGAEREAQEQARRAAMARVVQRLQRAEVATLGELLALHGIDAAAAGTLESRLEEKFAVQSAINSPQAGMAGAATGAAMGASVDLLTGGLTLGAAAALGALVGGGAAFLGAAWKNRTGDQGVTTVRLSDDMLLALCEAALLRYLAVIHWERGPAGARLGDFPAAWRSEVVAAVATRRAELLALWASVREAAASAEGAAEPVAGLAEQLKDTMRRLLARLYPATAQGPG
ncbi:MAG: DUF3482 domain-containing protein [Ramlibacter sp.]|nr:DUF3482 domain-containing protein [Ramlibacter sp.]